MIIIADYNSEWPKEFEKIRASLLTILQPLVISIDHIGSTAIPGMSAKDVIDIQITAHELSSEIIKRLTDAGYEYKESITCDHVPLGDDTNPALWLKLFFKQSALNRPSNIHVRVLGNPNQHYPILFRDYLRARPKAAQSIAHIKKQISIRHADDIDAYYDIKDPVYDLIWYAAQEWEKQNKTLT
jgi:GrpB-like predicted nucleotidyltransferase (UPF0157 family)